MRIITCNVNGLHSAHAKGFTAWLARQEADVACLQEIGAHESDLPRELLAPRGLLAQGRFSRTATICAEPVFSDHAPVVIDYDYEL